MDTDVMIPAWPCLDCPACGKSFELDAGLATLVTCPDCAARFPPSQTGLVELLNATGTTLVDLPVAPATVPVPTPLREKYHLGRVLGSGGMGTVYKARALDTGRFVAIKFVTRIDQPEILTRFLREGRLMGRLNHPNVVAILEADELEGYPYLVLEYVDGGSLRDRMEAAGPMDPAEAVSWMVQILEGLAACHHAGIVHRDLKPENVLLTASGRAKIADLGVAKAVESVDVLKTRVGAVLGTPRYMAPEVLRGEPATAGSDVYSAGVLLYEMLTGRLPYAVDGHHALLRRHILSEPTPIAEVRPELSASLATAVMHALERKVVNRVIDASQWSAVLAGSATSLTGSS